MKEAEEEAWQEGAELYAAAGVVDAVGYQLLLLEYEPAVVQAAAGSQGTSLLARYLTGLELFVQWNTGQEAPLV